MTRRLTVAALVLLVAMVAVPAMADTIDFAGGSGGNLTFTPATGASLSVQNAPLGSLWVVSNGIQHAISGGLLNFTTGALIGTPVSGQTFFTFDGGGNFAITGAVPDIGLASTTLLSGVFSAGANSIASLPTAGGIGFFAGMLDVTSINSTLYQALFPQNGLPVFGGGSVASPVMQISFTAGSYSGSIASTNLAVTIPEPTSLLLMGSGMLFSAWLMRRFSGRAERT